MLVLVCGEPNSASSEKVVEQRDGKDQMTSRRSMVQQQLAQRSYGIQQTLQRHEA
jgi:hypothetical protein